MSFQQSAILIGRPTAPVRGNSERKLSSEELLGAQALKRTVSQAYTASREQYAAPKGHLGQQPSPQQHDSDVGKGNETSPPVIGKSGKKVSYRRKKKNELDMEVQKYLEAKRVAVIRVKQIRETNSRFVRQCHICGLLFMTSHCCEQML
jgi:hypothetical protein